MGPSLGQFFPGRAHGTVRSWEPWCGAFHVTVRCWEPWRSELFTCSLVLGALKNVCRPSTMKGNRVVGSSWGASYEALGSIWRAFWRPRDDLSGRLGALFGRPGALLDRLGGSSRLGALLRPSWEAPVAASGSHEGVLGVLVSRVFHVIGRTGSLGVQSSLRHRSYWEPWRSTLVTPSSVLEALTLKALYATVCTGSLSVQSVPRPRS